MQTETLTQSTPASTTKPVGRWRVRWRRLRRIFLGMLALGLIVLGPWPADNSSYRGSRYQRESIEALQAAPVLRAPAGPIQIGFAEADISPPLGHPLAGYSARTEQGYWDIDSRCFARALTVASGDTRVTILTVDMLLINAKLSRAILDRTHLAPEALYFTATHTHSGPGGWGEHPIEKLIAGPYDPQFFNTLADTLADVVLRSRGQLRPVEFGVISTLTKDRQRNRVERDAGLDDRLIALVFRPIPEQSEKPAAPAPPLAILVLFSAHATVCGSSNNNLNADYPGELVGALRRKTGCPNVLFAAAAVGEAAPAKLSMSNEAEGARLLGHALADDLAKILSNIRFERHVSLATLWVPVELPAFRIPVSKRWRVSPVCSSWISNRQSYLHALRVGPAVLVGFPGDYSGRLAGPLIEWCGNRGMTAVTTSFNGDYKGYFVSERAFMTFGTYETREMNFFGPWAGEYLADLSQSLVERLVMEP